MGSEIQSACSRLGARISLLFLGDAIFEFSKRLWVGYDLLAGFLSKGLPSETLLSCIIN